MCNKGLNKNDYSVLFYLDWKNCKKYRKFKKGHVRTCPFWREKIYFINSSAIFSDFSSISLCKLFMVCCNVVIVGTWNDPTNSSLLETSVGKYDDLVEFRGI